jgi:hypothetical protein
MKQTNQNLHTDAMDELLLLLAEELQKLQTNDGPAMTLISNLKKDIEGMIKWRSLETEYLQLTGGEVFYCVPTASC